MEPQEKTASVRWFELMGRPLRRISAIQWLISCGVVIVLAITLGTWLLVMQFRDRAMDDAERELANTAQLLCGISIKSSRSCSASTMTS